MTERTFDLNRIKQVVKDYNPLSYENRGKALAPAATGEFFGVLSEKIYPFQTYTGGQVLNLHSIPQKSLMRTKGPGEFLHSWYYIPSMRYFGDKPYLYRITHTDIQDGFAWHGQKKVLTTGPSLELEIENYSMQEFPAYMASHVLWGWSPALIHGFINKFGLDTYINICETREVKIYLSGISEHEKKPWTKLSPQPVMVS
jgi:hypothetical protein